MPESRIDTLDKRTTKLEDRVEKLEVQAEQFSRDVLNIRGDVVRLHNDLLENTRVTDQIRVDTKTLVELSKGAAAFRQLMIWVAGGAGALTSMYVLYDMIKSHM